MLPPIQNGGLTAPPGAARGLGGNRVPRQARRRVPRRSRSAKEQAIYQAIAKRQGATGTPAGRVQVREQTRTQRALANAQPRAAAQGVAGNVNADLGKQLDRRVQSGAIDEGQAQKVAQDRAVLEAAYGPNWRVKVFGDKGYVQRTRQGLKEDPSDPAKKALYDSLLKSRESALTRARQKMARKTAARSPLA